MNPLFPQLSDVDLTDLRVVLARLQRFAAAGETRDVLTHKGRVMGGWACVSVGSFDGAILYDRKQLYTSGGVSVAAVASTPTEVVSRLQEIVDGAL